MDIENHEKGASVGEPEVRCTALVGAPSVESEEKKCRTCAGYGYVEPSWNFLGTRKCFVCDGTGRLERIAPTKQISQPHEIQSGAPKED